MQQFNANQVQQEEKPKHNIFSTEDYGIGRLEFLGCNILIYIMVLCVVSLLAFVAALIGIDKITIKIFGFGFAAISLIYLYTLTYAHRLYHIGWTDDMNSKTIACLLMIVCVGGSCIPLINLFAGLLWFILTVVLLIVPGDNE